MATALHTDRSVSYDTRGAGARFPRRRGPPDPADTTPQGPPPCVPSASVPPRPGPSPPPPHPPAGWLRSSPSAVTTAPSCTPTPPPRRRPDERQHRTTP